MGSEVLSRKQYYDISMSKRTRKPTLNLNQESDHHDHQNCLSPAERCTTTSLKINQVVDVVYDQGVEIINGNKKSLKELIEGKRGTSLREHFTEETEEKQQLQVQLQMVVKQPEDHNHNGVKFKQMMSHYTKVVSHMMRIKRDYGLGLSKKSPFRLKHKS